MGRIFEKHPLEMTLEEIDAVMDKYFANISKAALVKNRLKAGFPPEAIIMPEQTEVAGEL